MSKKAAKKRNLPVEFSDDENDGDIVPATAPNAADQLEGPEDLLPLAQKGERGASLVRMPTKGWRYVASHLEKMLSAVTYLFNILPTANQATTSAVALMDTPTFPVTSMMAIVQNAADIPRADAAPAISATAPDSTATSPAVRPSPMRWLPPVCAFSAAGGDWTAFCRHFEAVYRSVDWSMDEALRALPTALDDDSLTAFYSIPEADRSSLADAYSTMAAIFDPPSNSCRRFLLRKWRDTEMALAFLSVLLALRQAAYPSMDRAALDSLALVRLLALARELGIVLSIADDNDLMSLQVARNIQAHLIHRGWPAAMACTEEKGNSESSDGSSAFASWSQDRRHEEVRGGRPPVE
ncbi:uncharacterized protein LOC142924846 [Petromyzon marinus]|uniref:uncharacterized protein LOC142924846 n=1 Tax=Petromyzon marinus TaxID=7757 RepID=UPI003F71E471